MAGLPPDGEWVVQQIDGEVVVLNTYSQEEVVRFKASDANSAALAQKVIYDDTRLTDEQKCFAYFWSGYFYAHGGYHG